MIRTCPKCNVDLFTQQGKDIDYSLCDRCCGMWIEWSHLSNLLTRRGEKIDAATLRSELSQGGSPSGLLCPSCRNRFLRGTNILGNEVDWCLGCRGIFLDSGELEKISGVQVREFLDPETRAMAEGVLTGILDGFVRAIASGALR